jgi:hypothetical protein
MHTCISNNPNNNHNNSNNNVETRNIHHEQHWSPLLEKAHDVHADAMSMNTVQGDARERAVVVSSLRLVDLTLMRWCCVAVVMQSAMPVDRAASFRTAMSMLRLKRWV